MNDTYNPILDRQSFERMSAERYVRRLQEEFHLPEPVRLVDDQTAGRVEHLSQHAVGWYDPESDRITLNIERLAREAEASGEYLNDVIGKTIFHEGVGHYGLRLLLGEKFGKTMAHIYDNANPELREGLDRKRAQLSDVRDGKGHNIHKDTPEEAMKVLTVEEYMSELAEAMHDNPPKSRNPIKWLAEAISTAMKKMLFTFHSVGESDLKWILERSYRNVRHRSKLAIIPRFTDAIGRKWHNTFTEILRSPFKRHTLQSKNLRMGRAPDTPLPPSSAATLVKAFAWVTVPYIMIVRWLVQKTNAEIDEKLNPQQQKMQKTDLRPVTRTAEKTPTKPKVREVLHQFGNETDKVTIRPSSHHLSSITQQQPSRLKPQTLEAQRPKTYKQDIERSI